MHVLAEQAIVAHFLTRAGFGAQKSETLQQEWELARQQTLARIDELEAFSDRLAKDAEFEADVRLWAQIKKNTQDKRQLLAQISTVVGKVFLALRDNKVEELESLRAVETKLRGQFEARSDELSDLRRQIAVNANLELAAIYDRVLTTSLAAAALALVLAALVGFQLHRAVSRPLAAFMSFVARVGEGDLTQKTAQIGRDELGRLGQYLNGMVDSLAVVATQTRGAVVDLNAQTAELQASAQQQVASTSEQSASVQQISSTLDEIRQLGGQIAERSKNVAATAESTSTAGRAGLAAVDETGRVMGQISEQAEAVARTIVALTEKTQSIGDIIATVNDIAERSDLLALNAAIEAASAGEFGQSFAVVAEEMKSLAGQAKEATGQVRGLLGDIQQGTNTSVMQTEEAVKRAEAGQKQIAATQQLIESLVASVEQSVATFQQIVAATNQQQIGIEQVGQAIQNIHEASQQLTAGTRELERSAVSLNQLGVQLQTSVERYVV
jgi:methyl-accepting chemotaxis protein